MTRKIRLAELRDGILKMAAFVYILTFLVVAGRPMVINYALSKKTFEDLVVYHEVFSPWPTVAHDAQARFISDFEIIHVPDGGFRMEWDETMQCDARPFDGIDSYTYEAEAITTSKKYLANRNRIRVEEREINIGWPVRVQRNAQHDPHRQTPIMRYPSYDSNCRLRSVVSLLFPSGHVKTKVVYSAVVFVRGEKSLIDP